jgi:hypothetical protein
MTLHKENLNEDAWGMRKAGKSLSTYENNCREYGHIAGGVYKE